MVTNYLSFKNTINFRVLLDLLVDKNVPSHELNAATLVLSMVARFLIFKS